uniref:Ig-like domain-containing protein n=1 Tax=Myripristis murdjan TaxID=586833 RepID=A0A667XHL7_9TELE
MSLNNVINLWANNQLVRSYFGRTLISFLMALTSRSMWLISSISFNQFPEPPKPVLKQETRWLDVFPSETVELSCKPENSDWTLTWHKDGQPLSDDPLTIIPTSKSNSGNYVCRGQHKGKPVTTGDSNSLTLRVYENKPKPVVTQSPSFDKMYSGEPVSFTCRVDSSSGWEYVWYQNAAELTTGPNYTVNHPTTSNNGQYWCQAKRGETPFETEKSETKTLQFSDKPKPILSKDPGITEMYVGETWSISCKVHVSSGWEYLWYKDGQQLPTSDSNKTISPLAHSDGGVYKCKATRGKTAFFTDDSEEATLHILGQVWLLYLYPQVNLVCILLSCLCLISIRKS